MHRFLVRYFVGWYELGDGRLVINYLLLSIGLL